PPMTRSASAPRPNVTTGPTHAGLGFRAATSGSCGAAAGFGGAAEIFGGGGGHVISPSFTTVAPRTTSSSISTTTVPSLLGDMSVSRWRRLVAYIWLDCAGRRLGRSV